MQFYFLFQSYPVTTCFIIWTLQKGNINMYGYGIILGLVEKLTNIKPGPSSFQGAVSAFKRIENPEQTQGLMQSSPFPMRGETAGALGDRMGFRRGSIPFTCLSLSSFMCSIHLVPGGFLLACRVRAVVAVEMVESMMGVSSMALRSPIPSPSVRGSSSPLLE